MNVEKIKQYQKSGFDVICVNLYIITDMADMIVPNYYVLSDPVSFNVQSTSDDILINKKIMARIAELNLPIFIPAQYSNLNIIKQYCKQYYIFNRLDEDGIESGIKNRSDASTKARGSPYRAECIRERRRLGYEKWREKYEYGQRWASEETFSAVKRIFGESVKASSIKGMFHEVKMKFIFYNMLLNVA